MNRLQRLFYLFFAGMLIFCTTTYAAPQPTDRFFVNDFANVLSPETEDYIFTASRAYYESNKTQVVVTTVESLDGKDIERYSLELARNWGIGDKDKDNGVLILLAVTDREIRIEVGTGLEGAITDTKSGKFIRRAKEQLSANDFDSGLKSIYNDVIGELENPTPNEDDNAGIISTIIPLVIFIFLIFLINLRGGGRRGGHFYGGGWHGGFYGGSGSFGGRGGFGGGSGGGFSGGGGGFSGGGASGKF